VWLCLPHSPRPNPKNIVAKATRSIGWAFSPLKGKLLTILFKNIRIYLPIYYSKHGKAWGKLR
jgi:hypothetical protein